MENENQPTPSSNTSDTRKGYSESNEVQPNGPNKPGTAKEPTETETTDNVKDKPVNAEKKLHGK